jgi:hypothetical protein
MGILSTPTLTVMKCMGRYSIWDLSYGVILYEEEIVPYCMGSGARVAGAVVPVKFLKIR